MATNAIMFAQEMLSNGPLDVRSTVQRCRVPMPETETTQFVVCRPRESLCNVSIVLATRDAGCLPLHPGKPSLRAKLAH